MHPSGDRGLLGIAVDSSFASNRYLYLLYTYDTSSSHPTGPKTSRLTRVTVNANNTASAETVLVGSHRRRAVPGAVEHERLHPLRRRVAFDRHGPLRARWHGLDRLG